MSLLAQYDGVVCDLDGVVYAGPVAIPHAVEALLSARADGLPIAYATNNASRPPSLVAEHLRSFGLELDDADVINSSMAGAHVLAEHLAPNAAVLAIGGEGVHLALKSHDFVAVQPDEASPQKVSAVLQGYGPGIRAKDLAEAAYAIQGGALWVATNTDRTLPTDRGIAPGNGSLIAAVQMAVQPKPLVVGKPEPVMYVMASERMNMAPSDVLAIGDRLETDIEGAVKAGMDSVLVLTGVHGWADAAAAPRPLRPTYVLNDLRGLSEDYRLEAALGWNTATEHFVGSARGIAQLRGCLLDCWRMIDAGDLQPEQAYAAMKALA